MSHAAQRLQKIHIEKSGLGGRLRRLHRIIATRHPSIGRVALALYDTGTDLLKTFVASNENEQSLSHHQAHLSDVPSLAALRDSRKARVVDDLALSFGSHSRHSRWLLEQGYRSSYTLPIHQGDALLGFLFFDARNAGAFTTEVTRFLDVFGDIIAQLYLLRVAAYNALVGAVDVATGLARIRDVETGRHLQRLAAFTRLIAHARADELQLDDETIEYLYLFAPLHDIGKVGIPDRVLLKPGRLDGEEWRLMQSHVQIGLDLVDHIVEELGLRSDPAAQVMRDVIGAHHERGDGSGYPLGLELAQIPLAGRILAVADVYDALTSARPYKPAWSDARALEELQREATLGRLDAGCVQALKQASVERRAILERLADLPS